MKVYSLVKISEKTRVHCLERIPEKKKEQSITQTPVEKKQNTTPVATGSTKAVEKSINQEKRLIYIEGCGLMERWYNEKTNTLIIPEGYTHIMEHGLDACRLQLERLVIPKSIWWIDKKAFANCNKLKEIEVHPENKYFCIRNGALCRKDAFEKFWEPAQKAADLKAAWGQPQEEGKIQEQTRVKESTIGQTQAKTQEQSRTSLQTNSISTSNSVATGTNRISRSTSTVENEYTSNITDEQLDAWLKTPEGMAFLQSVTIGGVQPTTKEAKETPKEPIYIDEDTAEWLETSEGKAFAQELAEKRKQSKAEKEKIAVVGVGGAGLNFVNRVKETGYNGKLGRFIAIDTDNQSLRLCKADKRVQIGRSALNGEGTQDNDVLGKIAAEESVQEIQIALQGVEIMFLVGGTAGGTGGGALPVIANIAKKMGILTIAVVTKPFKFEVKNRHENAKQSIESLGKVADTLIAIDNDKLLEIVDRKATMPEALQHLDMLYWQVIKGIINLVDQTNIKHISVAELQTAMKNKGQAYIGIGESSGEGKVIDALQKAKNSVWMENAMGSASQIVLMLSGDVTEREANYVKNYVENRANGAKVICGAKKDVAKREAASVVIVAYKGKVGENKPTQPTSSSTQNTKPAEKAKGLRLPAFLTRKK